MRVHKALEPFQDGVRPLTGDQAKGDLRRRFGGNDGFSARPGIAADDAVDLQRRAGPELFQEAAIRLARRARQANRPENPRFVEAKLPPLPQLCLGGLDDAIVEAGNLDTALRIV